MEDRFREEADKWRTSGGQVANEVGKEAEEAEYTRCTIIFVICAGRPRDLDGEVRDVGRRREEADDVVEQLGKHVAERRECQRERVSDVAAERALEPLRLDDECDAGEMGQRWMRADDGREGALWVVCQK